MLNIFHVYIPATEMSSISFSFLDWVGKAVATKLPFRNELNWEKGPPWQRSSVIYQRTCQALQERRGCPSKLE